MDNLTENEKKRLKLLTEIQEMIHSDYKYADIASVLGISTRTVIRYKDCNPLEQCQLKRPSRNKEAIQYKDEILRLITEGYHASGIASMLQEKGCQLGASTIRRYAKKQLMNAELISAKPEKALYPKTKKGFKKSRQKQ